MANPPKMTPDSLEALRARFYSLDQDTSGLALADLIRLGREATPILVEALAQANPRTRRLAAEGLGDIADPASAEALFNATRDPNGEVRARAAAALDRLKDERALPALVATLNDYPDILHAPYTASMFPLMQGGREVLPLVIPLLRSTDELTRSRAFLVVKAVASRLLRGKDWDRFWDEMGRYDPLGPQAGRDHAARLLEEWVRPHDDAAKQP